MVTSRPSIRAGDLDFYLRGWNDGAGATWRAAAELARSSISDAGLREVIAGMAESTTTRVDDQRVGRCGDTLTPLLPGSPRSVCALPAGHAGWHRADDGGEWSKGSVVAP